MNRKIITVKPDGTMQFVHDDRLRGLLHQGAASIKRMSNVEPGDVERGQNPLGWYADLAASSGPVLGPFETRQAALNAEVEWINTNVLTEAKCKPA